MSPPPDTVALRYEDYPSAGHFLGREFNEYTEDIFVGYRYFETFARDAVLFPFGFGLSYTTFAFRRLGAAVSDDLVRIELQVENIGRRAGRQVAQVYFEAPQGRLGKPARCLAVFEKTRLLEPGRSQRMTLEFPVQDMASYDESGACGFRSAWVLEAGDYVLYAGADVRSAERCGTVRVESLRVVRQCREAAAPAPEHPFLRMVRRSGADAGQPRFEPVPTATRSLRRRIEENLPRELPPAGDRGLRLEDAASGRCTPEQFVAQLEPEELDALARGALVMDSPLGAKGNAGVLGGVTKPLRARGVPPVTVTDGPSGIRLQCYASLLPCASALAACWDTDLVRRLSEEHGKEMRMKKSDVLLSPGMNIHRDPLCGRNFEYFSEDPLLTGRMGAAVVQGLQSSGAAACPKHFACNNQETNRSGCDSRLSERALREIYLKGFEICVLTAAPKFMMTSYNKINGVWGHYHYDLCTEILRGEWGYSGCVMTDWWMRSCRDPDFPALSDSAYRIRAQVDVLMPGAKNREGDPDTAALESLRRPDGLTRAELQRSACNVVRFLLSRQPLNEE